MFLNIVYQYAGLAGVIGLVAVIAGLVIHFKDRDLRNGVE